MAAIDDIFYGNQLLNVTSRSGINDYVSDYDGRKAWRFYSWDSRSQPSFIKFSNPVSNEYTLTINVQITARNVGSNGYCYISLNENVNGDIKLFPDQTGCDGTIGGLSFDNYDSQCISGINKDGYIDNLKFINTINESYIYLDDQLLYTIPYHIPSSFGFGCINAVAFVNKFEWQIAGLPTLSPRITPSPTSRPTWASYYWTTTTSEGGYDKGIFIKWYSTTMYSIGCWEDPSVLRRRGLSLVWIILIPVIASIVLVIGCIAYIQNKKKENTVREVEGVEPYQNTNNQSKYSKVEETEGEGTVSTMVGV